LLDAKPAEHTCADRPNLGRHLQPLDPGARTPRLGELMVAGWGLPPLRLKLPKLG
jgi:hypothetical protein